MSERRQRDECDQPNKLFLFRESVLNNFKNIARSVSYDEFREALTILKKNRTVSRKVYDAMVKSLYDDTSKELEALFNEGSIQEALAKVQQLKEETDIPEDQQAWRPPGDVLRHVRSLDAAKIKAKTEELEERIRLIESANDELRETVSRRRRVVNSINQRVEWGLSNLPLAVEAMEKKRQQLERCLETIETDEEPEYER